MQCNLAKRLLYGTECTDDTVGWVQASKACKGEASECPWIFQQQNS